MVARLEGFCGSSQGLGVVDPRPGQAGTLGPGSGRAAGDEPHASRSLRALLDSDGTLLPGPGARGERARDDGLKPSGKQHTMRTLRIGRTELLTATPGGPGDERHVHDKHGDGIDLQDVRRHFARYGGRGCSAVTGLSADGLVSMGERGIYGRVDLRTGEVTWTQKTILETRTCLDGLRAIDPSGLTQGSSRLCRLDLASGDLLWVADRQGLLTYRNELSRVAPDGSLLWSTTLETLGFDPARTVFRSGPILFQGTRFVRVNPEDGALLWERELPAAVGALDLMADSFGSDGLVRCTQGLVRLDPESGQLLWQLTAADLARSGFHFSDKTRVSREGLLYDDSQRTRTVRVPVEGPGPGYRDELQAIPPRTLRIDLQTGRPLWQSERLRPSFGLSSLHGVRGSDGRRFLTEQGVARLDPRGEIEFSTDILGPDQRAGLAELGITRLERFYSGEFVDHVLTNRRLLEQGDRAALLSRPLTVLFYTRDDEARVFERNNLDEFATKNGSHVLYFEIDGEQDLYRCLDQLKRVLGDPLPDGAIQNLVLAAHSEQTSMRFGPIGATSSVKDAERARLDLSDGRELSRYAGLFHGTHIVSIGCSSGEGGAQAPNVLNLLATSLGRHASRLTAPTDDVQSYFSFDEQGRFLGPLFFDRDEHPLSESQYYRIER